MFQGINNRYKMKHAALSMQPVEMQRISPLARRSAGGNGKFLKHLKHPFLAAFSALPR
jgi:hypothetical protein